MDKQAKAKVFILLFLLILTCVLIGVVFAATVNVSLTHMAGNKTVSTGNTIYQSTNINFTLTNPASNGLGDNITNVTILLDKTYFTFQFGSNKSNATFVFTNSTAVGGNITLVWNISDAGTFGNSTTYWFSFNVTPKSNVETLSSIIIVQVGNISGGTWLAEDVSNTISVDNKNPVVTLLTANYTNSSTNESVLLNYAVVDINNDTCVLYIANSTATSTNNNLSWQAIETKTSPFTNFTYNFSTGDGLYIWNVYCNDTLGHGNFTTTNRTIGIDTTPPTYDSTYFAQVSVTNTTPVTGDIITLTVNWSDATLRVHTVRLLVNGTEVNSTAAVTDGSPVNLSWTITSAYVGTTWEIYGWANDSRGNINSTTTPILLTITDGTAPGPIDLNAPADDFNTSSGSIVFNWTAYDNSDLTFDCNLTINKTTYANVTSVTNASWRNVTVDISGFNDGTYNWSITCWDSVGSANTSTQYNFTYDTTAPAYEILAATNGSNYTERDLNASMAYSVTEGGVIYVYHNWTDATSALYQAWLQVYNASSDKLEWVNVTDAMVVAAANVYAFNYTTTTGHNAFEPGINVTLRVQARDYAGNVNTSINFSVWVNDTTAPTIAINIPTVNSSNLTGTYLTLNWSITEKMAMTEINYTIDSVTLATGTCSDWARFVSPIDPDTYKEYEVCPFKANGLCSASSCGTAISSKSGHNITIRVRDSWGNSRTIFYKFTIDNVKPSITLTSPSNNTNMTPTSTAINISVVDDISDVNKTIYVTDCNLTEASFTNHTDFYPFNRVGCIETEDQRTLTITVTDYSGNENQTTYIFNVDNVPPTISATFPAGNNTGGPMNITFSASDGLLGISNVGYYLDGLSTYHELVAGNLGSVFSSTNLTDFSAGSHTIILSANDTVGNRGNSTTYSFTIVKPYNMATFAMNLQNNQSGDVSNATVRFPNNGSIVPGLSNVSRGFEVWITTNTSGVGLNVTLAGFTGSEANWDVTFTVVNNHTIWDNIAGNWTTTVERLVFFNDSVDSFISGNDNYYGTVDLPINASISGYFIYWFENESIFTYAGRTLLGECGNAAGGTSAYSKTETVPCYNITSAIRTIAYVPHFSVLAQVNDTTAPKVTVNSPTTTMSKASDYFNFTTTMDAVFCSFMINYSNGSSYSSAENSTNITDTTLSTINGARYCISDDVIHFKNGVNENYSLTVFINDSAGNMNVTKLAFNVSDSTDPTITFNSTTNITIAATTATIIWASNEYTNASVQYGTSTTLGTRASGTIFSNVKTMSVSLSDLSSGTNGTYYYYNITTCDRAGNCAINGTYNFRTSATAAEEEEEAATTSGGGGGTAPVSLVAEKAAQYWGTIEAGGSAVMAITEADIPVTKLTVEMANTVTNAELSVASLTGAPTTEIVLNETVYKYIDITKKNIVDEDISKVTIQFTVTKAWLTENGINEDDVVLARYNGVWAELTTTKISSTDTIVTYEAEAAGLSYFAITTKKAVAEQVPAEEVTPPTEEVTPPTEEVPPEEVTPPTVTPPEEKPSTAWVWWVLLVAVVVIAGVIYFVKRKK